MTVWDPGYPVEWIDWIDSSGYASWRETDEFENPKLSIRSVGMIVAEDDVSVTLALNASELGSVSHATTIPKVAIVRRFVLEIE